MIDICETAESRREKKKKERRKKKKEEETTAAKYNGLPITILYAAITNVRETHEKVYGNA